ncbi:uncharacterized protein FIBRA_08933 [Fibroporia radiculosa]|uniref:Uncharacterized protein n=1 Tax=Fibroporia radiculosa TaxID=599839 RepID=J4GXN1_9APHY|nr:uncharacterized protein FIBRA_08933 [Fibroporia radiculosa]CCM06650.1 predicted protein [Fibroporia radiculosa]
MYRARTLTGVKREADSHCDDCWVVDECDYVLETERHLAASWLYMRGEAGSRKPLEDVDSPFIGICTNLEAANPFGTAVLRQFRPQSDAWILPRDWSSRHIVAGVNNGTA